MIHSEIKKMIIDDLKNLSFEMQKRVQEFTHALLVSQSKGTPGKELVKFSGIIDDEDAEKIREAVDEGCEKVDFNEW